jgi:hypothetical protein
MFDLVYGYQPPKFQKLTGDDLQIVKSLVAGELDDILQGRQDYLILFNLVILTFLQRNKLN